VARNRAIPEARGEILVFVDDDIVARRGWLHALLEGFADPRVACVTGRVIPHGVSYFGEQETKRVYFGHEAGTSRTLWPDDDSCERLLQGRTLAGFGCNMAFRREFLLDHALFPEDLGAGSLVGAADENYMFVQVLKQGLRIRYTPRAEVTHDFEADPAPLRARAKQIHAANLAFNLKLLAEERSLRRAVLKNLLTGALRFIRKSVGTLPSGPLSPADKLMSYWHGLWLYWRSRKAADLAATTHADVRGPGGRAGHVPRQ
jgi:GT2 family glycosyltransferase